MRTLHSIKVRLGMEGGTIVDITPMDMTYHLRVHPHVYVDIPSLLSVAALEGDGTGDEVGTMIVVKAEWGWCTCSKVHAWVVVG